MIFFLLLIIYYFIRKEKKIIIGVDISKTFLNLGGGPVSLQKGIAKVLNYESKKCKFISFKQISPENIPKNIDYFYNSYPLMKESEYNLWKEKNRANSLLLGPNLVPSFWYGFPNKRYWSERNFRDLLLSTKAHVVHSIRVRDYLATRSNTTDLINKFIILRPCTNIMPKDIESFENRENDIIIFEKYKDENHGKEGAQLIELFKNANKTVQRIVYGYYNKKNSLKLVNNTKFLIYFSFFDTGGLGLKEFQNQGIIIFSHQEDFINSNKTSYYIPELAYKDIKPAFNKIMNIMDEIIKIKPDTKLIAEINQEHNRCEGALDDICNGILNSK